MNCFRHPTEEAAVFCKGCAKALCLACCTKTVGGETHVCSEECAKIASERAAVEKAEQRESLFDKVYAAVFLTVLLTLLGGGFSLCTIKNAISHQELSTKTDAEIRRRHFMGTEYYCVKIFYALGITTWKPQFGIGATLGAMGAVVYLRNYRKTAK